MSEALDDLYKRYKSDGRNGPIDLQAAQEISKVQITSEEIDKQIQQLKAEGFDEGIGVRMVATPERKGTIVGFNRNQSGFYSADRYPLLVRWSGEKEVFEYSKEFLTIENS